MTSPNYASFLPFTPSESGRKVFIDPNLIVDFAQYVDPRTETGKGIIVAMDQRLSSLAGGLTSGQATAEPKAFYIDFGHIEGHTVRVFYTIFQDSPPGTTKGSGVYITKFLRFEQNKNGSQIGLLNMTYRAPVWHGEKITNGKLSQSILRIGSKSVGGQLGDLDSLAVDLLSTVGHGSYKTDFNLYHSPLAVVEYGNEYATPDSRRMLLNPQDLADILYNTVSVNKFSAESALKFESYTCYVHGDGAKILKGALAILSRQGRKLEGFHFKLYSPSVPYSIIHHLAESCSAKITLDKATMNFVSSQYQKLDDKSLDSASIEAQHKISAYISSKASVSFQELWLHMKSSLLPVEV